MVRIADSVLGSDLLERVAEFLLDLRTTYDGVAQRGREIERVMRESAIVVVTTADPAPVGEAVRFFRDLPRLASRPEVVVFNRSLPKSWIGAKPQADVSAELMSTADQWSAEAQRQVDARSEFEARYGAEVATIPWMEHPPTQLAGLSDLAESAAGFPWNRLGVG